MAGIWIPSGTGWNGDGFDAGTERVFNSCTLLSCPGILLGSCSVSIILFTHFIARSNLPASSSLKFTTNASP